MNYLMEATKALNEYIDVMNIDLFAIPSYELGLKILQIDTMDFAKLVCEYADKNKVFPMLEMRKNEGFFRLRARYTATTNMPLLVGVRTEIITPKQRYKRLEDIPHKRAIVARDFELLVADSVNGIHYGDDISAIDVIDTLGRRIECKIGKGLLIKQGTTERGDK